jgi:hypothetical protein
VISVGKLLFGQFDVAKSAFIVVLWCVLRFIGLIGLLGRFVSFTANGKLSVSGKVDNFIEEISGSKCRQNRKFWEFGFLYEVVSSNPRNFRMHFRSMT